VAIGRFQVNVDDVGAHHDGARHARAATAAGADHLSSVEDRAPRLGAIKGKRSSTT